jgi:type III secretion protein V
MDGAMKFVKGDAIAGIVIAVVNIVAGLAIGTLMLGMGVGEALQRYAILTVGDGMVSQIPSLLVSIAAGVVITRVGGSEGRDGQLAGQISRQVLAHPRALLIAGIAVASFLLVPGFPKWVFAVLALVIIGTGLVMRQSLRRGRTPAWMSYDDAAQDDASLLPEAIAAPLALRLSAGLRGELDRSALDQRLASAKAQLEADLGPVFPRLQLSHAAGLPEHGYQVLVHDVAVEVGAVKPGHWMLAPDTAGAVGGGEVAEPFGPFPRVVWVPSLTPEMSGLAPEDVIGTHLEHVVRARIAQFIGLQDVQRLLHAVQRDAPELSAEVARVIPPQRLAEVLRRLLQEDIPIRNLHTIFESVATWAPKEADTIALTELVRIDLGRWITSRHVGARRELHAILFETPLLDRLVGAISRTARGNLLLLSPAAGQDIREQVQRALAGGGAAGRAVVAIVSSDVRRYVKNLVEPVAPRLPVLSYQELDEDVALQPVGWVTNPAME